VIEEINDGNQTIAAECACIHHQKGPINVLIDEELLISFIEVHFFMVEQKTLE
jgi:hypothetical protein